MQFDTAAELAALQAQTRRIRQVRYRPSRLDRYTGELLSLYQAGASAAELQRWLRARRIKVVLSTVTRWLEKMAKFASAARQAAGVIKPLGKYSALCRHGPELRAGTDPRRRVDESQPD